MQDLIASFTDLWHSWPTWLQNILLVVAGATGATLVSFYKDVLTSGLRRLTHLLGSFASSSWQDRKFEKEYLNWVVAKHKDLTLVGVQAENKPGLEDVFVSLRISPYSSQSSTYSNVSALTRSAASDEPELENTRVLSVGDVARASQRVVILGDPGAGKTTLLQFIAVTFAREHASEKAFRRRGIVKQKLGAATWRLPIFVPLRAVTEERFTQWPILVSLSPHLRYPEGYFERQLKKGRCVLLLDGLDEVKSEDDQKRVAKAIQDLSAPPYSNNQFIVSCRIAGWRNLLSSEFAKLEVREFDRAEIHYFIRSWYKAVEYSQVIGKEPETARQMREMKVHRQSTELLEALDRNERLRRLARNPLLLSIIAVVHRTRVVLPRQRAKLYRECTELLLELWDVARGVQVDDTGLNLDQKLVLMRSIAYALQESGQPQGSRQMLENIIGKQLRSIDSLRIDARQLLRLLEQRSGLIVERSIDVLSFAHLTFQEYFAAQSIVYDRIKLRHLQARERLFDPKWREVVLLYVGIIENATEFVRDIYRLEDEDIFYSRLRLAARCLNEAVKIDRSLRTNIISTLLSIWYQTPFRLLREEINEVVMSFDNEDISREISSLIHSNTLDISHHVIAAFSERSLQQVEGELEDWLSKLKDSDPQIRLEAMDGLAKHKLHDPKAINALVDVLEDSNLQVRSKAMNTLFRMRRLNDDVLEAIVAQYGSSDVQIRYKVIIALGEVGLLSARALNVLVEALDDPNPTIIAAAAKSFAHLRQGPAEVVNRLRSHLGKGPSTVRIQVAKALFALEQPDEATFKVIRQGLQDTDWLIRMAAADVLREARQAHIVLEELLVLLRDLEWRVRVAAINALATLHEPNEIVTDEIAQLLTDPRQEVSENAILALIQLGDDSEALLNRLTDIMNSSDEDLRYRAISALSHSPSANSRLFSKIRQSLEDPSPTVRGAAIVALNQISPDSPELINTLMYALSDTQYSDKHKTTVQQLAYETLYQIHLRSGTWMTMKTTHSTSRRG